MEDISHPPKITIVTPSYNQGDFLEATLLSVLEQNYPNLEYLVMDGGSTDASVDIIGKYADRLDFWCSEKDEGQSDALVKGLERSTGDILCWVNSDDILSEGALHTVATALPLNIPGWLVGHSRQINRSGGKGSKIRLAGEINKHTFFQYKYRWFSQPSVFWNRKMMDAAGYPDKKYQYIMDLDLFYRMYCVAPPVIVDTILSEYRIHADAKTTKEALPVDREYAAWMYQHLKDENTGVELGNDILLDYIQLQRSYRTLQEHPVISRVAKMWKKYINKRIFIDKQY
ncbi:glycosyltransferase [Gammaproteobacteria bacterium]|nr:glycosyltransferase [Gammaproteobacteria bacterium]